MKNTMKKVLALMLALAAICSIAVMPSSAASVTLKKGHTYTVKIALYKSDKNEKSMAASSFKGTAMIKVNSKGKKTMYVYTKPMTYSGVTASLQEMKVETSSGGWQQAKVVKKDSDGNPSCFKFTLPHTKNYIKVKVNPHVEMMGNKYLDARIKVNWSSLTDTTK